MLPFTRAGSELNSVRRFRVAGDVKPQPQDGRIKPRLEKELEVAPVQAECRRAGAGRLQAV